MDYESAVTHRTKSRPRYCASQLHNAHCVSPSGEVQLVVRPDDDTHLEVKLVVRRARPGAGRDRCWRVPNRGCRASGRRAWVVVLSPERFVTNKLTPNWRRPPAPLEIEMDLSFPISIFVNAAPPAVARAMRLRCGKGMGDGATLFVYLTFKGLRVANSSRACSMLRSGLVRARERCRTLSLS
jgi:hypothetical protein